MKTYHPLITIKEKTDTSPAEFLELLTTSSATNNSTGNDIIVDSDIYALLQALNDEVL